MADSASIAGPPPAPSSGNDLVSFARSAAERIRDSTTYVERMVRGGAPAARRGSPGSLTPGMLAVTGGTAINPGTFTVPTSGTVTFRKFDGTTLSADTVTVPAFNWHDRTIAAGSLVFLAWALGAWWIIDVRSCSNLS